MSRVYKNMGLDDIMPFGKYKGKSFEDIYKLDVGYLVWLRHTRKSQNGDGAFFSHELHILLDDAIDKDKGLRKKYEKWNVAALTDADPVTPAIATGTPPWEDDDPQDLNDMLKAEKEAEFAYSESWGSF